MKPRRITNKILTSNRIGRFTSPMDKRFPSGSKKKECGIREENIGVIEVSRKKITEVNVYPKRNQKMCIRDRSKSSLFDTQNHTFYMKILSPVFFLAH